MRGGSGREVIDVLKQYRSCFYWDVSQFFKVREQSGEWHGLVIVGFDKSPYFVLGHLLFKRSQPAFKERFEGSVFY